MKGGRAMKSESERYDEFFAAWSHFVPDRKRFREILRKIIDTNLSIPWWRFRKSDLHPDQEMRNNCNNLWAAFSPVLGPGMDRLFAIPRINYFLYLVIFLIAFAFPLLHVLGYLSLYEPAWLDRNLGFQHGFTLFFLALFLAVYFFDVVLDIRKRKGLASHLEGLSHLMDQWEQRLLKRNSILFFSRLAVDSRVKTLFRQEVLRTILELEDKGILPQDPRNGSWLPENEMDRQEAIESYLSTADLSRRSYEGNVDTVRGWGFKSESIQEMREAGTPTSVNAHEEEIVGRGESLALNLADHDEGIIELTEEMRIRDEPKGEPMVEDAGSFRADPRRDRPANPDDYPEGRD